MTIRSLSSSPSLKIPNSPRIVIATIYTRRPPSGCAAMLRAQEEQQIVAYVTIGGAKTACRADSATDLHCSTVAAAL